MNPLCPDCGTPLVHQFRRLPGCRVPYWTCPLCHDEVVKWFEDNMRESTEEFARKYRYVEKDGFVEIEEKPQ